MIPARGGLRWGADWHRPAPSSVAHIQHWRCVVTQLMQRCPLGIALLIALAAHARADTMPATQSASALTTRSFDIAELLEVYPMNSNAPLLGVGATDDPKEDASAI